MPFQPKETLKSKLSVEYKTMTENSPSTRATKKTINEVDLYNQQIDNETEAVMKQRVAKLTRESYERINITFILWLFYCHNKYHSLLQPKLYDMMKTNKLEDVYRMTIRGKRSKSRHGIRTV